MGHYSDTLQSKGKSFEGKQSHLSSRPLYADMTPPPSYQSSDGTWAHRASRPVCSRDRGFHAAPGGQATFSQHAASENDELTINRGPRADRQRHHHRRRSSPSHNRSWVAALIFQGLRSNLFGSGDTGHSGRGSTGRTMASRKTKPDFSTVCREVHNHYTIHNHWQNVGPDKHLSHTET